MKLLVKNKDSDNALGKHGIDAYYSKLLYWIMRDNSDIGDDLNRKGSRHPDYDVFISNDKVSVRVGSKEAQYTHDTFLKLVLQGRQSILLKELTKQIILDDLI
jgi:hypothetical protein